MKVEVWTRGGPDPNDRRRGVQSKRVWVGELPVIPRAGDGIVIRPGYCSETVYRLDWDDLPGSEVKITLACIDADGDYPEVPL